MMPFHKAILHAAKNNNKLAVGFASPDAETIEFVQKLGYDLISISTDVSMLKERNNQIMEIVKK